MGHKALLKYLLKRILPPVLGLFFFYASVYIFSNDYEVSEDRLYRAYKHDLSSYNWLNNLNSIDGIVLGSSTLRYGLSMDSINKNLHQTWVNLAMDARDPVVCFLLLKKTLSTHNPKIVVMGLDPWIYSKYYYRHRSEIMYFDFNFEEKIYFGFEKKNLPFVLARNMINTSRNAFNEEKTPSKPTPKGLGSIELKRSAVNFKEVNDDWFKLNRYNWSELQFE